MSRIAFVTKNLSSRIVRKPFGRQLTKSFMASTIATNELSVSKLNEDKKAMLKSKFEEMLRSDDPQHKEEVLLLLQNSSKEQGEPSLISKFGLDDWKFAVPVGLMVGIPIISNEILVINEETQLLACFMLFCATMYNFGAPVITKHCDNVRAEEMKLYREADEYLLIDLKEAIKANEKCLGMESAVTDIYSITDSLSVAQADLLNSLERHKMRDAVAKKVASLITIEEAAASAIRQRMIDQVRSEVQSTFANDKKAKENALAHAISVLTAGGKGKLGKDVVGEAFKSSLSNYRTEYSKIPEGGDAILVQLKKDVAAVAEMPEVGDLDAGNVYVTHPLPGLAKA